MDKKKEIIYCEFCDAQVQKCNMPKHLKNMHGIPDVRNCKIHSYV